MTSPRPKYGEALVAGGLAYSSDADAFTTRRASGENARRIDESASALCKSHVANAGWKRFTIGTNVVTIRYL